MGGNYSAFSGMCNIAFKTMLQFCENLEENPFPPYHNKWGSCLDRLSKQASHICRVLENRPGQFPKISYIDRRPQTSRFFSAYFILGLWSRGTIYERVFNRLVKHITYSPVDQQTHPQTLDPRPQLLLPWGGGGSFRTLKKQFPT